MFLLSFLHSSIPTLLSSTNLFLASAAFGIYSNIKSDYYSIFSRYLLTSVLFLYTLKVISKTIRSFTLFLVTAQLMQMHYIKIPIMFLPFSILPSISKKPDKLLAFLRFAGLLLPSTVLSIKLGIMLTLPILLLGNASKVYILVPTSMLISTPILTPVSMFILTSILLFTLALIQFLIPTLILVITLIQCLY